MSCHMPQTSGTTWTDTFLCDERLLLSLVTSPVNANTNTSVSYGLFYLQSQIGVVNSQHYNTLPTILLIQFFFSPHIIAHPLTLAHGSRTPSHGREYTYDLCKSCLLFLEDIVHSSYFYICASILEVLSSNFGTVEPCWKL